MVPTDLLWGQHGERLAHIESDVGAIKVSLVEIERKMELHFVTRAELKPMRNIVYGFVALVLMGFAVTLMSMVWNTGAK